MNNKNSITPYNSNITDLLNQLIGALRNGTEITMINNQLLQYMLMRGDQQNQASSQSWIGWGVGVAVSTISFSLQSFFMIGQIFMIISMIKNVMRQRNNEQNQNNAQNLTQAQAQFLNFLAQDTNTLNRLMNATRNSNDQHNDAGNTEQRRQPNRQCKQKRPSGSLDENSTEPHTSKKQEEKITSKNSKIR